MSFDLSSRGLRALAASCALAIALPGAASAALLGVSGPVSSAGTGPAIIGAPSDALDDLVTNTGMQGFDEAQQVTLASNILVDGGGIAAGTRVDSHMIFLNSQGRSRLSHFNVDWTFTGTILGIMSDGQGQFEAASTSQLGAPGTNYTVPSLGTGPAPPFNARGLERNDGVGDGPNDGYALVDPFTLRVGMVVTEPGDWIRVVTAAVPVPAALPLMAFALGGLGLAARRQRCRAA
jgi:hypothetical protein